MLAENLPYIVTFLGREAEIADAKGHFGRRAVIRDREFGTEFYSRFHGSNRPESAASFEHCFAPEGREFSQMRIVANAHTAMGASAFMDKPEKDRAANFDRSGANERLKPMPRSARRPKSLFRKVARM